MPFKSEAQRKYLWANEPEIARDWTDTYGSGIAKALGGRIGFQEGGYDWSSEDNPELLQKMNDAVDKAVNDYLGKIKSGEISFPDNLQLEIDKVGNKTRHDMIQSQSDQPEIFSETLQEGLDKSNIQQKQKRSREQELLDEMNQTRLSDEDWLKEADARNLTASSGMFGTDATYVDDIKQPMSDSAFLYSPRGPEGIMKTDSFIDPVDGNYIPRKRPIQDFEFSKYQGPSQEEEGWDYTTNQGITGPNKWQQFLSKATRQPYRAATAGAGGYNAAQLNQMNALGGYYSEPARQQRRDRSRVSNMLARQAADKPYSQKNLNILTMGSRPGHYDRPGGDSSVQGTSTPAEPGGWHPGAAQGGLIGSVGGISRPKYQQGNMVGAEIEGAEMEGAMMQSQEVIKELYDALIAQGLSPQEAMEKIKQIIASTQTEGPQSPMMGEEFPGQEFGRAPAAFGGIMDTYTGRRKYGLGSFIKKAFKKVKKLASSKLGKLALMYAAGTYLGGTQALSGQAGGMGTFAQRLKNPKLLANFLKPQQWGTAGTTGASSLDAAARARAAMTSNEAYRGLGKVADKSLFQKGLGFLQDHPTAAILGTSLGAGAYTAAQPPEELGGEVTAEYDDKKAWWDNYLASLDSDYSIDPSLLKSAQGGRVGRQEGGLMNLGGMEKDYRNDGGFVPLGGEEKADDVPARLSRNEFVFTADAVRNAGGGDIDRGAEVMENVMKNLEGGGQISEESQGQGAQEMFEVSERLSEVI